MSIEKSVSLEEQYNQHLDDLYNILLSLGYSQTVADQTVSMKTALCNAEEWMELEEKKNRIPLARRTPLHLFCKKGLKKEFTDDEEKDLHCIGYDLNYPIVVDVSAYTFMNKRYVGAHILGNERTDKEWLSELDDNGRKVASMDAQLRGSDDITMLHELERMQ